MVDSNEASKSLAVPTVSMLFWMRQLISRDLDRISIYICIQTNGFSIHAALSRQVSHSLIQ